MGYVNLTLKPGYNLVTAQLKDAASPTAEINTILTNAPTLADGSTFFSWNPATQDFNQSANWISPGSGGPAWYNADFSALVTDTAPRGTSFFIFNAGADATLTLVGEVPQGADSATVPANYGFLADFVPAVQEIKTNGFPIATGSTLATFNPLTQDYDPSLNGVGAGDGGPDWYNADFSAVINFTPAVGQGFLHFNAAGAAAWNRNFTVK